ncbi:MAG: hypothetical protein CMC85_00280 [Flavobacteriaceae bacterium]|nr:hypothetical protein [Flavobacteriaceae bacterium]
MKFYFRISTCSLIILLAHYLIIDLTVSAKFIIPLWKIYVFNFTSLSLIYFGLLINFNHNLFNHLYFFVFATILKMIAAIIILRPLFSINNSDLTFEVLNFFFLYFIFLFIEIISLRNILSKL